MEREKYKSNKSELLVGDKAQKQCLFEKYGIHYTERDVKTESERDKLLDRQQYLFDGLCDKGIDHTNIEKVLDIAIEELHQQEIIKQNIEYKVSFLMAFLGILLGVLVQGNIFNQLFLWIKESSLWSIRQIMACSLLGMLLLCAISVLISIFRALQPKQYQRIIIDNEVFQATVDSKEMALVALLEAATYALDRNSDYNNKKSKILSHLIVESIVFIVIVIMTVLILAG